MKNLNRHAIDLLCKSPLDYWWHYERPERNEYIESADAKFDKALRCAVFDRTAFDVLYVRTRKFDFRKPIDKAEFYTMETATKSKGQIMLNTEPYDAILKMRAELLKHPLTGHKILPFCRPSDNVVHENIQFKPHALHPGFGYGENIVNLTSTKNPATLDGFQKDLAMFNWHRKAALQIDGTSATEMIFIVCEHKEPFNIGVYVLDERAIDLGRQGYKQAIEKYKSSKESGIWPGVSPTIVTAGLPEWFYKNR